MWSKDVVDTLDQQTSQIGVAGLRDPELRVPISGLTASRSQAEIAPDTAALLDALLAARVRTNVRAVRWPTPWTFSNASVSGYCV